MIPEKVKELLKVVENAKLTSDDPKTQTGACIVKRGELYSFGTNTLPRGVAHKPERLVKPNKYKFLEHAERNAIYKCARNGIALDGASMVMRWFPCSDCAKAIIQVGISILYCETPDLEMPYWGEDFKAALEMLNESTVQIVYIDGL